MQLNYLSNQEKTIKENEGEVNLLILKIYTYILILFPITLFLRVVKIVITPWNDLIPVIVIGLLICSVPIIYYKIKPNNAKFKYVAISSSVLLVTLFYSYLFVNVLLLWTFPISLACLYFDTKLIKFTSILMIPNFIIGEVFSSISHQQFFAGYQWIPLHIIIFGLEFYLLYKIFVSFANRARTMLFDSHSLLNNLNYILEDTQSTSKDLKESVCVLMENMCQTNKATKQITDSIKVIESDSRIFLGRVNKTNEVVDKVVKDISSTTDKSKKIMSRTNEMIDMSSKNKNDLLKTINEIEQVEVFTENAKQKVLILAEGSKEIKDAISLINEITKETNLLSLNASIEASRSGDAGKGFGVVALEIKKLSNQSKNTTDHIEKVLHNTFSDIDKAVKSIADTYEVVINGLNLIKKTALTFDTMTIIQKDIYEQIASITNFIEALNADGFFIAGTMNALRVSNELTYSNIANISASIEQLSASASEITHYIKSIEDRAKALTDIELYTK